MRLSDWKAEQWLKSSRYLMRTRCIGKVKLLRLWNAKRATRGYCYPKSWGQWARENLFKRRLTERNDHGSK